MSDFDPYHIWLGIPETERPISKYRLLAITDFEDNRDVISTAAERQTVFLRTLQAGEHTVLVADLLNEVSQARVTLLNADQKAAYDEELLKQQTPEPEAEPAPPPIPVVQTPAPVVVRGTVTQEFPVSVVQPSKRPRRRKQKQIWKRPVVIGVSLVGVIGVFVLFISMMSSGDADPVVSNSQPVVTSPSEPEPAPEPKAPQPETPPTIPPQPEPEPEPESGSESEAQPAVSTLAGHTNTVYCVSFSHDGKSVASAGLASVGGKNNIMIWDTWTGERLKTIEGVPDRVFSIAFSTDGKTIASGNWDRTIKFWDIDTGAPLGNLGGHANYVRTVAFSPGGKIIASGSNDQTIKLWDAGTGTELRTLTGHSHDVNSVAFSPDGNIIASGSRDQTIKLWDSKTGLELWTVKVARSSILSVAFSPNGKMIASGCSDNTIKLWDAGTGTELSTLTGHSDDVNSVAFSPNGKTIASGSDDNTIKLWDVETRTELNSLVGHSHRVFSVAFAPDGKMIASGSADKTIKLWDLGSAPAQTAANTLPASLQQGLIAYYPFNGNAQDESGNGNDGIVHGASLAADRHGKQQASYQFDGRDDSILFNSVFPLNEIGARSLSFWLNVTSAKPKNSAAIIWGRDSLTDDNRFHFWLSSGPEFSISFDIKNGKTTLIGKPINLTKSVWQFVSLTRSNDRYKVYVNGIPTIAYLDKNANLPSSTGWALAGRRRFFNGLIDDIRIYNRALSAAEVKALYEYESKPPVRRPNEPVPQPGTLPPIAVAPFDSVAAKAHQAAWANSWGVPITFKNSIGMTFQLIPPGTFTMGAAPDSEPLHTVTISRPFYMGIHEVTQANYQKIIGENPSEFKGDNKPVEKVSWNAATSFCNKMNERMATPKSGLHYRLPTEAEWEYACRSGTAGLYSFSNGNLADYAWYKGAGSSQNVGERLPNPWGMHDMHGNVFEWCHDWLGDYPTNNATDPQGPTEGSRKVFRGGSWYTSSWANRSDVRHSQIPTWDSSSDMGFRIVLEVENNFGSGR
jgi:WD40 repeat protein/formylglycine-generating enzyme required for sulfatase activity